MTLRLSPEDQAEYERLCNENNAIKYAATAAGDARTARRARQANTALYQEFQRRQLPPPAPTRWEIEEMMTLEQRIERIEQHLKLGHFSED